MIGYLRGEIAANNGDKQILDVNGVGYSIFVLPDDQGSNPPGKKAVYYISESIKENAYDLFGFSSENRKHLFELLLGVNGVGPKAAMAILSLGNESNVRTAIATADVLYIKNAKGVGKKAAEKVVLELKNKVGLGDGANIDNILNQPSENDEAMTALISLGYSRDEATQRLQKIDPNLTVEDKIKTALKK